MDKVREMAKLFREMADLYDELANIEENKELDSQKKEAIRYELLGKIMVNMLKVEKLNEEDN